MLFQSFRLLMARKCSFRWVSIKYSSPSPIINARRRVLRNGGFLLTREKWAMFRMLIENEGRHKCKPSVINKTWRVRHWEKLLLLLLRLASVCLWKELRWVHLDLVPTTELTQTSGGLLGITIGVSTGLFQKVQIHCSGILTFDSCPWFTHWGLRW